MMSLRLDKWFGSWGRGFSPDYTPAETGPDRFIAWSKPSGWIGKAAALAERKTGPSRRLVSIEVDVTDAKVVTWEPVRPDSKAVGWCMSGGYSHWTGKSLAMGFLPADRVKDGLPLEAEILVVRRPARAHFGPVWYDGGRMRD